jgi:hypothetical protein
VSSLVAKVLSVPSNSAMQQLCQQRIDPAAGLIPPAA